MDVPWWLALITFVVGVLAGMTFTGSRWMKSYKPTRAALQQPVQRNPGQRLGAEPLQGGNVNITLKTEIGPFEGTPKAGELIDALTHLPVQAYVTLETWDSQMDGSGWRIMAQWTESR